MAPKGFTSGESIVSQDVRDDAIARLVDGQSFADVGGLYNLLGEKCSVAARSGARDVTMIDIIPSDDPLWKRFSERMQQQQINNYHCISADVINLNGPQFDVIHSSGVLYHLPNPMAYVRKLRSMTRQALIISTTITPEIIQNQYGEYRVPGSAAIFVPALSSAERAVLAEYWRPHGCVIGITEDSPFEYDDVGPWWWLPTRQTFIALCERCGFSLIAEGTFAAGDVCVLVMQPKPGNQL